jgi:antitoxin ParD1/3/4
MLESGSVSPGSESGMDISLPSELEQYVENQVQSGVYRSASEMIGEGLRILKEKEIRQGTLRELRREIQIGIDQAERGHFSDFTAEMLESIAGEGRERLAAERKSTTL